MRLVEVLVASTVLAVASTSSLQMAASSATVQQGTLRRERQWAEMERDRLRLQALWRQSRHETSPCTGITLELQRLASSLPPPSPIERQLQVSADGTEVLVHWSVTGDPGLQRQRRFSPAALGLCPAEAEAGLAEPNVLAGDAVQAGDTVQMPQTNPTAEASGVAVQP